VITRAIFGLSGAFWMLLAPLIAFWAMWEFAFKTKAHYYTGNAIIALVLLGPPIFMTAIYAFSTMKRSND